MSPIAVEAVALRSGTSADWAATNLILGLGELGADTDTGTLKLGDGVTPWADLPASGGGGGGEESPTYAVSGTTVLTTSMGPVLLAESSDYPFRDDQFSLDGDTLTCLEAGDYKFEVYLQATLSGAGFGTAGVLQIETNVSVNEENAGPAWNYYPKSSTFVQGTTSAIGIVAFSFPQTLAEDDEVQLLARYEIPPDSDLDLGGVVVRVAPTFAALMITKTA